MTGVQTCALPISALADVIEYWKRFKAHGVNIMYTITHGNAISCYFKDPDGNILEVYWKTGLEARQGFLIGLDFNKSEAELMAEVRELVKQHGEKGYIDFKLLEEQNL